MNPLIIKYQVYGTKKIHTDLNKIRRKVEDDGANSLAYKLAEVGRLYATEKFAKAQYDGTNDVIVNPPYKVGDAMVLEARGNAVAFIEFGTGVHYSEVHPQAAEFGLVRGGFGHHLGRFDYWRYTGDPGTHGIEIPEGMKHEGEILTHGNPPARAMYEASKEMRDKLTSIVREVLYG